jgi:putative tributyrin esterase
MAFCELRYRSESLGMHTAAHVFLPQRQGPFATLYLLHGLGGDHTIWQRFTRLESYLEELDLPLIVVAPNGRRGFYVDARQGFAYESSIIKDLIPFIDATFQTRAEREGRAIPSRYACCRNLDRPYCQR